MSVAFLIVATVRINKELLRSRVNKGTAHMASSNANCPPRYAAELSSSGLLGHNGHPAAHLLAPRRETSV